MPLNSCSRGTSLGRCAAYYLLALLAFAPASAVRGEAICGRSVDPGAALTQAQRLEEQGEREAAISCYRRALTALPARDLPGRVDARTGLARLLDGLGAFQEARAQLKRALAEAEVSEGSEAERTADVLNWLGWVEFELGRYPDSERHLRRAQSIYEGMPASPALKLNYVLTELGNVYREQGDYDRAESVLAQALAVLDRPEAANEAALREAERANGLPMGAINVRARRAAGYNNLAGVAYYRGDYRRAIELYSKTYALLEDLYGESRLEVALAANNLGLMYYEVGEYELARRHLERALRLKTAMRGAQSATVGSTLSNLGELESASGDMDRALGYFAGAEKVLSRSLGATHPQVAEVLLHWATLLDDRGDAAGARPLRERALAIRTSKFGADSKQVAEVLTAIAPDWSAQGERRKGADAARRALAIAATADQQELVWNAYRAYARILVQDGRLPAAAFYGKYAINTLQSMRAGLAPLGKRVPESFLLRRESAYRELADTLITLGRLPEAEEVIAMLKEEEFFGYTGLASIRGGASLRAAFSADEARQADRLDAAARELASMPRSHPEPADRPREPSGDARYRRNRLEYDRVVRSVDDALARAARSPVPSRSPLQAGAAVDAHTAVLTYLLAPERVRLIVRVGGTVEPYSLAVTTAALNRMVFDFRQVLQNPGSDPLPAAQELYRVLFLPVQPRLATTDVATLELVLDGALRYLPYAALHDGDRFLLERYRIAFRTSSAQPRQPDVAPEQERLAGFGVTRAVGGFPALPRVHDELDNIVRSDRADSHGFLPGVVALDYEFTADRLSRTLNEQYPLVHIASHFVVRPGRLSESYLLLGDGSRLTLEQMKAGALSFRGVRLLTLSACSTAVGGPDATGAEFESFSVLAGRLGAREVLATLWSVADNSTSALMARFYRLRRQGGGTASALTEAQRTMLTVGGRHGRYWHPYYWAPFVVFLNDRPS